MANQEIIVKPNYSKRTFTIRVYSYNNLYKNKPLINKYRTHRLTKEEFQSELYNTTNDWRQFLKSDDYYVVK